MNDSDFEFLASMLKERSGLVVTKDKLYLLESRLLPLAKDQQLDGLEGLITALRAPGSDSLKEQVTEAMTTNESFFFRDQTPFDNFKEVVLPELLERNAARKQIRIWCCAASTGQEPYSLAMLLSEEAAKLRDWRVEILATDISGEVLEKAKVGLYSQFEVQRGLPITLLAKYFAESGSMWQIDSALRAMVTYKPFNLLDNMTHLGQFDMVFCRNVLIYFDVDAKTEILGRISRQMSAGGSLFLGAAETVIGVTDDFVPVKGRRGLYALQGAASSADVPLVAGA